MIKRPMTTRTKITHVAGRAATIALLTVLGGCGIFSKGEERATPTLGQRVPILAAENAITADASLAGVQVLLPPAAPNAGWTQSGGSASKSMGHLALGQSLHRLWSAEISGGTSRARLAAAPVVADNRLYVVDVEGKVNAFDADTGARLWVKDTAEGNANRDARFGGGVSFDNGRLYATNGLGDVVAMDAVSGDVVWRARPGGPLRGAPTIANGNVYVLTQDNQLIALSQQDGTVGWSENAAIESQGVFGVAAPAAAQGSVVAGFSSGELNAYRYENGRTLWSDVLSRSTISTSVSSLSDIDADPVIDQGRVYAVGQGGRMVAMDLTSGQRLWEQNIAGISTPWVAGEWIFVVTDNAQLLCLSRGSGRVRWMAQLRRWKKERQEKGPVSWTGPVLAGGRLVLFNSLGEIAFASPDDGSVMQTIDTDQELTLRPVVANNTLYALDEKGRLSAWR